MCSVLWPQKFTYTHTDIRVIVTVSHLSVHYWCRLPTCDTVML